MNSNIESRGNVTFPEFIGERVYMHEFTKRGGLPSHLARWNDTVNAMLDGVDAPGAIYLMVDQKPVQANTTHRRGGIHVDGVWCYDRHRTGHITLSPSKWKQVPDWMIDATTDQHLLLASDVVGCAAYIGEYEDTPKNGGDCSHIDVSGMQRVYMEPNTIWMGDALTMLHESIPIAYDCFRTVVRLNVNKE